MKFEYIELKDSTNIADKMESDELLVVLDYKFDAEQKFAASLIEESFPSLESKHHYLRIQSGFFENQSKPWVVASFEEEGNSSLERRWVFNKLCSYLKSRKSPKKISFWIEGKKLAEKQVLAEDLHASVMDARYIENPLNSFKIYSPNSDEMKESDPHQKIRQQHVLEYRQWVNENPDELTSIEIGKRLKSFAEKNDCQYEVLAEKELTENNMNLLLAVGQGSRLSPSRLHLVDYDPNGKKESPLLIIGKGVTFDTGGINLKPHESYVNCMKNDMGGAALTSQLFQALVKSGFSKRIVLAVPCCENLIAEKSMKPGSIIKSHSGKDVIIEHTDAEGRLILADAISYCQERYKPAKTIVAATLTTAALRQFTNFITPVHFMDKDLRLKLNASAEKWGESYTFWNKFLPFLSGNKTNAADLTNMGRMPAQSVGSGGSSVAAHFLDQFASSPIVHFDIFASTWNWSADYPGAHYGATGAPFNSLFSCLSENGASWMD